MIDSEGNIDYYAVIDINSINYLIIQKKWKEIISKLGMNVLSNEIKLDNCIVCFEKSNCITECNHSYCFKCIYEWLKKKQTCPCCRAEVNVSNCKLQVH